MARSLDKSLLDIVNAYLAVEALMQSELVTAETMQKLKETLKFLDLESSKLLKQLAATDPLHRRAAAE